MSVLFRQPIVDTFDINICTAKSQRHVIDFQVQDRVRGQDQGPFSVDPESFCGNPDQISVDPDQISVDLDLFCVDLDLLCEATDSFYVDPDSFSVEADSNSFSEDPYQIQVQYLYLPRVIYPSFKIQPLPPSLKRRAGKKFKKCLCQKFRTDQSGLSLHSFWSKKIRMYLLTSYY